MKELITELDPTAVIEQTGTWLIPLAEELMPVLVIALGVMIAGLYIGWLRDEISEAMENVADRRYAKKYADDTHSETDILVNKMTDLNRTAKTRKLRSWQVREVWNQMKKED